MDLIGSWEVLSRDVLLVALYLGNENSYFFEEIVESEVKGWEMHTMTFWVDNFY